MHNNTHNQRQVKAKHSSHLYAIIHSDGVLKIFNVTENKESIMVGLSGHYSSSSFQGSTGKEIS